MSTYSPQDFEKSRFDYKEKVRLYLYAQNGAILKTVTGRLYAREEGIDVGGGRTKTLVWIKEIEGYEVPHEDLPGHTEAKREGWFPEHDIEKLDAKDPAAMLPVN